MNVGIIHNECGYGYDDIEYRWMVVGGSSICNMYVMWWGRRLNLNHCHLHLFTVKPGYNFLFLKQLLKLKAELAVDLMRKGR
jgi:hypothetical protein